MVSNFCSRQASTIDTETNSLLAQFHSQNLAKDRFDALISSKVLILCGAQGSSRTNCNTGSM